MDAILLITILGLGLAVYQIIPNDRKLDLKIRLNLFDYSVVLFSLASLHYILYFPILNKIRFGLRLDTQKLINLGFNANNVSYLIILLTGIFLIIRINKAPLRKSKIKIFYKLSNTLLQEKKYFDLLSLFKNHCQNLFRIYSANFFLSKLKKKLAPKINFFSILKKIDSDEDINEKKYLKLILDIKIKIKNLLIPIGSKFSKLLPAYKEESNIAKSIIGKMLLSENFIEYMAKTDPYFALNLLDYKFWEKEEFLQLYIQYLLEYRSSILHFEIKNNQSSSLFRYNIDNKNIFISYFLKDIHVAEKLRIYKPFGDFSIYFLERLLRDPINDRYNEPFRYYEQEEKGEKWHCPIYLTIKFFGLMVSEALFQNIEWHMWLYYFPIISDKIIRNISPTTNVDLTNEWPTAYHYLLYEMVSTMSNWIETVKDIPDKQKNIQLSNNDIKHENNNIPKSAILALSEIIYSVLKSDSLNLKFKGYLLGVVLRTIRDLKNDKKTKPFADILRKAIKQGGPIKYQEDRAYTEILNQSLEYIDHTLRYELEDKSIYD